MEERAIDTSGIAWAVAALQMGAEDYRLAADYYEGRQPLAFATDKFRNAFGRMLQAFSINHCAICVDVPADRLQIEGFKVLAQVGESPVAVLCDAAEEQVSRAGGLRAAVAAASAAISILRALLEAAGWKKGFPNKAERKWQEIWRRNRMKKRSGEIHSEMLKCGDAYAVVDWKDNRATIFPNMAGRCAVDYDPENPGVVKRAARWWSEAVAGGHAIRLNLYYPDRIEKYTTVRRRYSTLAERAAEFRWIAEDAIVPNPYGKVPVFHFANNADMGARGRSELSNIMAPQDGLNKAVCDAMVGAEYAVLGQRYVTGLEIRLDDNGRPISPFKDGLANLWVAPPTVDENGQVIPDAPQPTFGQFSAANLDQLLSIRAAFRGDISLISGIPAHYFMQATGGWPSGQSLKTAETRLTSKIEDRQIAASTPWEDMMRLCLEIEGVRDVELETVWRNTGPTDTTADVANAAIKREKLGYPETVLWEELGAKPSEIGTWKELKAQEASDQYTAENTVSVPTVGQ